MYCVDCGEEILEGANYCVGCGKVLRSGGGVVQKKKKRFSRIVLGLIVLTFGLMFIGYSSSTKEEQFNVGNAILGYGTIIFATYFVAWFIRRSVKKMRKNKPKD